MKNGKTEEEIQEIKKEYIDLSIKKEPVDTLTECLNYYTKAKLFELGEEQEESVSIHQLKDEMIELIEEILLKNVEEDKLELTDDEKKAIEQVIKGEETDKINIEDTKSFRRLGYIFWFYNKKEFNLVCPKEIAEKYMNTKEEVPALSKIENKILDYADALKNIYGVFELDQLVKVWNEHNEDKLDEDTAAKALNKAEERQDNFWWNPPYIIADNFSDEEEYEEFFKTRVVEDYYIPRKEELELYIKETFDRDIIYYQRILNYFSNTGSLSMIKLNKLMSSLEECSVENNSFHDMVEEIQDDGFKFNNSNELNRLLINYINLSSNTRKWYLKGHKPVELPDEEANENVDSSNDNTITNNKKIGRNEPCPCRSGKKYKHCCGR